MLCSSDGSPSFLLSLPFINEFVKSHCFLVVSHFTKSFTTIIFFQFLQLNVHYIFMIIYSFSIFLFRPIISLTCLHSHDFLWVTFYFFDHIISVSIFFKCDYKFWINNLNCFLRIWFLSNYSLSMSVVWYSNSIIVFVVGLFLLDVIHWYCLEFYSHTMSHYSGIFGYFESLLLFQRW